MNKNILANFWLWLSLMILLLILIIAHVPASFAAYAFTKAVPGLSLAEIRGTLWRGSAGSAQMIINNQIYSLGRFNWHLKPLSLITFSPCADVSTQFQSQNAKGQICAHSGSLEVSDVSVNVPAALAALVVPVTLGGDLSLLVTEARLDNNQLSQVSGNLSWRNGAFHDGNQWIPVGSFGAMLSGDQRGGVNAKLEDLGGPVQVNMDINYNPALRPRDDIGIQLQGLVALRGIAHPDLKTIFPTIAGAIGEPEGGGFAIEWQQ